MATNKRDLDFIRENDFYEWILAYWMERERSGRNVGGWISEVVSSLMAQIKKRGTCVAPMVSNSILLLMSLVRDQYRDNQKRVESELPPAETNQLLQEIACVWD